MQSFRGDHFHMHDVGKGTNICLLGSIEASVCMESSPSLFPPLKLGSPIPHPKISSTTSTESACSIPTRVPFADTNWKQGPWQNGLHWEKENISVIVTLLEVAIVRLGGKGGGIMCMHLLWCMVLPYIFHLWKRKMVFSFKLPWYCQKRRIRLKFKHFRLSTVKRKLNLH